MKSIRLMALIGLAMFAGVQAHAAKNYGSAGCGLGSVWMGKDGNQILAVTTNGATYSTFFGISSGTSNCKDEGTNTASNMKFYVEANKVALANDIARGSGETVDNLAQIVGCKDTHALATTLLKNYSRIYPNQNVEAKAVSRSIISAIQSDVKLAGSCNPTI